MSQPRPEAVQVQFTVEDGVTAEWDEARIAALVRAILAHELAQGPVARQPDDAPSGQNPGAARRVGRSSPQWSAQEQRQGARAASGHEPDNADAASRLGKTPPQRAVENPRQGASAAKRFDRATIALHLVSDETIRELNAAHRGKDVHTDVLSFPLQSAEDFVLPPDEPANLGDVVISYPRATEQAEEFGHTTDRELAYLVAHGVLHILGYDHEAEPDKVRMRQREEEALQPLGFTR
jgi:probable rRNA maturation factor